MWGSSGLRLRREDKTKAFQLGSRDDSRRFAMDPSAAAESSTNTLKPTAGPCQDLQLTIGRQQDGRAA
jgi:hypothetical protein